MLRDDLQTALFACQKGREVLLKYFGHLKNVEKKEMAGLVSEADRESEAVMKKILLDLDPAADFLGEETAFAENTKTYQKSDRRWILDPLDGTTNFVHSFPIFCISLGLEIKGEMQVAVIDVPIFQETYTAWKGGGAYVNGVRMKVSATETLEDSLLATGFFAEDKVALQEQIGFFTNIVSRAHAVRRPGAAAYDLAQVARGVFDGFWEKNLSPWDSAAGMLLVQEAGGRVVTYQGGKYSPFENTILATNGKIEAELLKYLKK